MRGASRTGPNVAAAEPVAATAGHQNVADWLSESRDWVSPLHHLKVITASHARDLLRDAADIRLAARAGGPTPLSLAQDLRTTNEASTDSAAYLVLRAAQQWSPETHHLFPRRARVWAVEVLRLGVLLSHRPMFSGEAVSFSDAWKGHVMPHAVDRQAG